MGSCTSKAPKIKTPEGRPTTKPSHQDLTQLSAINREDEAAAENGFPFLSPSKSQTPTKSASTTPQPDLADRDTPPDAKTLMPVTNNSGMCAGYVYIHGDLRMNEIVRENAKTESIEDFTRRFTQLQERLKRHFNAITMKGLPWMKNIKLTLKKYYVTLKMTECDSTGGNLTPQITTIQETFRAPEGQDKPFRILVEGGPGFGKTTFAAKLAYDWAQNEPYTSQFHIVLFIPLRHFTKGWRETLKLAARLRDDDDCEMLLNLLKGNTKRFLIIFDGYDELPEDYVGEINAIIQREVLPDVTVVVTSRPGKFTSNMEEERKEWFMQVEDIAIDANQFLSKKIVIEGFDSSMQSVFVKTYTDGFSNKIQQFVLQNVEQMQLNRVLPTEFLQCPLFFLMIVLLLTENRNADVQNLKTRTDLYKKVFNFVVRRYFAKDGNSTTAEIDLFSETRDKTSTYLRIMNQFSRFALYAIKKHTFAFSKKEILDNSAVCPNSNQLIPLDLGFLIETVLEECFHQKTVYEPIHKSLLEFAAAFFIWSAFLDNRQDLWQSQVHSLRPQKKLQLKSLTSLVFPFLAGMMGKDAWVLFEELRPYAAEYSLWFEPLKLSILEAKNTPKLFTSLVPLLPLELEVELDTKDNSFAVSRHHEEIIRYGTREGKIKLLKWNFYLDLSFPKGEVMVERLLLELDGPRFWRWCTFPSNDIQCMNMWCCCRTLEEPTAIEDWDEMIALAQAIQFRRISFVTYCGSFAISRIFAAVTSGVLQQVDINCIRYVVERNYSHLNEISQLIGADQFEAIELILYEPDDTFPGRTLYTPLIQKECFDNCCMSVSQKEMDYLVTCASKSKKLVRFVVENDPCNPLEIDVGMLCDGGCKSWKSVCLKGVTVICNAAITTSFQINYLQITDVFVNTAVELTNNLLTYCKVSSFACSRTKVLTANDFPAPNNCLKELLLQLDDAISHYEFSFYSVHISNLQILTLEMTSFPSDISLLSSVQTLFRSLSNTLHLRGIELLGVEYNHGFVELFIDYICGLCKLSPAKAIVEGYSKPNTTPQILFHLPYIMFHSEIHWDKLHLLPSKESIAKFISAISKLKSALEEQLLPRLDVLCYEEVLSYMWDGEEGGAPSLNSIFPVSKGFRFENDFYGMQDDDSVRSKELYARTPYPQNRVSITFNKPKSNSS